MLGADVVVAELQRLPQRQLQDLLGAGRERDVPRGRRATLADDLFNLLADGLEADAQRLERLGRDTLALVDEAQEDVLGADVVVVEEPGFFLGQDDHSASPVGEPFEQVLPPASRGIRGETLQPTRPHDAAGERWRGLLNPIARGAVLTVLRLWITYPDSSSGASSDSSVSWRRSSWGSTPTVSSIRPAAPSGCSTAAEEEVDGHDLGFPLGLRRSACLVEDRYQLGAQARHPPRPRPRPLPSATSWSTRARTVGRLEPSLTSTWQPTPSPSRTRPRRMCSVPM